MRWRITVEGTVNENLICLLIASVISEKTFLGHFGPSPSASVVEQCHRGLAPTLLSTLQSRKWWWVLRMGGVAMGKLCYPWLRVVEVGGQWSQRHVEEAHRHPAAGRAVPAGQGLRGRPPVASPRGPNSGCSHLPCSLTLLPVKPFPFTGIKQRTLLSLPKIVVFMKNEMLDIYPRKTFIAALLKIVRKWKPSIHRLING